MWAAWRVRHGALLIAAATVAISCSGNANAPGCPADPIGRSSPAFTMLALTCSTVGATLQCQAIANNSSELYSCPMEQDVTQLADWAVANPAIVKSVGTGSFSAVGPGDSVVNANWRNLASKRPVSVFPGTPPLPTYEIFGSVSQAGLVGPNSVIDGAVIQILNGLVAGRMVTSGVPPPLPPGYLGPFGGRGYYRLLGIPPDMYRVRITKDGYVSQERDVTVTGPGSPLVDFQLQPN
jgi:hypothetical protein